MLITTHFLVAFSLLVIWVPTGMYCRSLKRSASVSALALMREDREAKAKAHPSLAIIPRRHVESKNLDHLDILYLYIHIWTSFWLGIISLLSEQPIRSAIFARIYIYIHWTYYLSFRQSFTTGSVKRKTAQSRDLLCKVSCSGSSLLIRRKFVGSDTTAALANSSQKRTAACSMCSKEASSSSRCRAQQEE